LEALADEWLCEEDGYDLAEESMEIRRLVRCLPEQLKEIVLLRFSQELTLREIAEITHLPLRTAQSRLRTALKLIKKQLEVER
ncbi:MAG: sigma factor-like helix-turn-helix DNA-binding protein, partial [Clostridia bacterium]|nr:sigma factor-like helix-turn-helix DNA-binding protein [Clostridia bacterium]